MEQLIKFANQVNDAFADVLKRLGYHDQAIDELNEDILSIRHELRKLQERGDV